ncbi:hypothetical protein ACB092_07G027500 [Castanea dentata]
MACQMKKILLLLLLVLLVLNLQHCVDGTQQVPCFFIFGDSMSDNGNNNNLVTMAKANYQPYGIDFPEKPTGRFTNGRNLVDIIAEHLGFNNSIPPFATARGQEILEGVNYASGAAGIRKETEQQHILLGNNESLATAYLNKCIYSVAIGSNDYLNNYFLPQFYPTSRIYNQEQYATVLVQQLSQQLLLGALKIALFGLDFLGYTPVELTMCRNNSSYVDNINNAVALFNDKVVTLVNNFNNNLTNAKFIYINTNEISLSSSTFEGSIITNVPCCEVIKNPQPQTKCIPFGTTCSNRSQYSFWDAVHPTEVKYVVYRGRAYRAQSPADAYPHDIEHLA